ncbi:MAG: HDOD domain-containing protein [Gemmatimonadetes bacterium]|nr:HDOD domain-containing protein [Gemmatimonadota bacterium]
MDKKRANILVVDDEETVRRTCAALLNKMGHDATPASSADAAIALVRQKTFDVVLTDIRMPGMTGDKLIERLQEEQPDIVALIMTGYPSVDLAVDAVQKGVYQFLTKPFRMSDLRLAVARALERHQDQERRAHTSFAQALFEKERDLGDDFDMHTAIDELLESSRTDAPQSSAEQAGVEARETPATTQATSTSSDGDLRPLYVVVCEPVPSDKNTLRTSPSYHHFRTIYAAHKVMNQQLQQREIKAEVKLVMAGHSADIPRHFRRHAEDICCVVFGPNAPRLTEGMVRMTANGGRRRQVVVCHNPDQANFSWDDLEELSTRMEIWGTRGNADGDDVRLFWTRYFTQELMPLVDASVAESDEEDHPATPEEVRTRLARDHKAVEMLPGFPHVCRQVIDAIDVGKRFNDVAQILEVDGALQASILRTANLARYGARNRIETVATALSMIGMDETRKIIVGRAMAELMGKVDQAGFDSREFFLHAVSVGYLVQLLSLNMDDPTPRHRELIDSLRIPPEVQGALRRLELWTQFQVDDELDTFGLGVLHDTGKILNAVCYPDVIPLIMAEIESQEWRDVLAAERTVVGELEHPGAGGALLERWELFPEFVEPIAGHHRINDESSATTVLVALANGLAKMRFPFPQSLKATGDTESEDSRDDSENPLLSTFADICKSFSDARNDLEVSDEERETGKLEPENVEAVLATARRVSAEHETAVADFFTTLAEQSPEFPAVLKQVGTSPQDLVALMLTVDDFVGELVQGLLHGVRLKT